MQKKNIVILSSVITFFITVIFILIVLYFINIYIFNKHINNYYAERILLDSTKMNSEEMKLTKRFIQYNKDNAVDNLKKYFLNYNNVWVEEPIIDKLSNDRYKVNIKFKNNGDDDILLFPFIIKDLNRLIITNLKDKSNKKEIFIGQSISYYKPSKEWIDGFLVYPENGFHIKSIKPSDYYNFNFDLNDMDGIEKLIINISLINDVSCGKAEMFPEKIKNIKVQAPNKCSYSPKRIARYKVKLPQ